MDKNKLTVPVELDTSQLKKDLDSFKGTVDIQASTTILEKQIKTALKNASKDNSIILNCGINGMDSVTRQIGNAVAQLQNLKQTAYSLPSDLMLNVSVNSQGLQQYAGQLEHCLLLSERLNSLPLSQNTPKLDTASASSTSPTLTNSNVPSFKEANTESKGFLDTLNQIISVGRTPLSLFGPGGLTEGYGKLGSKITQNLD